MLSSSVPIKSVSLKVIHILRLSKMSKRVVNDIMTNIYVITNIQAKLQLYQRPDVKLEQ